METGVDFWGIKAFIVRDKGEGEVIWGVGGNAAVTLPHVLGNNN